MAVRCGAEVPVACSNSRQPKDSSARAITETYFGAASGRPSMTDFAFACFECDGSRSAESVVVSRR
jgi:hypothetical protein